MLQFLQRAGVDPVVTERYVMDTLQSLARIPQRLGLTLLRWHQDQRGAEGLEKLLIIAAIVLPLLIVLIFFREAIMDWVYSGWDDVTTEATSAPRARPSAP